MEFQTTTLFNQIIKRRLVNIGIQDVNKFLVALVGEDAIIAGSFPLQCILGEVYKAYDIDIFCHAASINDQNGKTKVEQYIYNTHKLRGTPEQYLINGIVRTRKYKISEQLIFNIIVVTDPPETFIKNNFDFSFCQTYFDGIKTTFRPITLSKIGIIVNYPQIKDIQSHHLTEGQTKRAQQRDTVCLYPANIKELLVDNLEQRKQKYKQRGFMIMDTVDFMGLKDLIKNESD